MTKKFWRYIISLLLLVTITAMLAVYSGSNSDLKIVMCDIGQGDAILIQKQSTQVLIDGGPNSSVLSCLSKYMPFWDRDIELVVLTHPQKDHHGGLKQVFQQYSVTNFMTTTAINDESQDYQDFLHIVSEEDTHQIIAHAGMHITINSINFDVLNPSKYSLDNFSTKEDLNVYSIVLLLSYGKFDGLFTGDIDPEISDQLSQLPELHNIEYLKIPHHGSKNGASENLISFTHPFIATISSGRNNRFGHPHKEIIDLLNKYNVSYLITRKMGDIVVTTDGSRYNIQNAKKQN